MFIISCFLTIWILKFGCKGTLFSSIEQYLKTMNFIFAIAQSTENA